LFAQALSKMVGVDGTLACTLRVAMLTGWAPAPSQPVALKPGSGKVSLATLFGDEPG
jgi:hypothetical protein